MMAKYNVGDEVRVTTKSAQLPQGTIAIIESGPFGSGRGGNYHFRGKQEVVLGDDLELVTQYKTEKRRANVGERILVTNRLFAEGYYANGDIRTVKESVFDGVKVAEHNIGLYHREYEVIVETPPTPPKPRKSERITALESQVATLQAKVEALEAVSKAEPTHYFADSFPLTTQFNNEAADEIMAEIKRKATMAGFR